MLSSLPARLVALLVLTSSAFELVLAANNCRVDVPASQDIYECVRVSIDSLEAAEERMLSLTPLSSPTDYDIDDGRGGTIKLNMFVSPSCTYERALTMLPAAARS